jgi:hypothetical protein
VAAVLCLGKRLETYNIPPVFDHVLPFIGIHAFEQGPHVEQLKEGGQQRGEDHQEKGN